MTTVDYFVTDHVFPTRALDDGRKFLGKNGRTLLYLYNHRSLQMTNFDSKFGNNADWAGKAYLYDS